MTSQKAPRPTVAIIGGGIGGLATAAFLRRSGLSSTVYEQASQLSEVGAGLVVAPNAARQLRKLGVLDDFRKRAVSLAIGWEFRRWQDGTVLSAENLADLVVGADGMHSVVRGSLFGSSPATYSGIYAFRPLVPADRAPDFALRSAQTLWIGPGHHLVHYPVSAGRYVNLVAFAPARDYTIESWTATATVEEFLAEFDGWDPRLIDLICASGTPGRWALLDRAPLARWGAGRATLLGDAAHPMFPFFAQGAAQAIEDAAVLARCLGDGPGDVRFALQRYERLRIPRTTRIQTTSHARAHINHLPDGPEQRDRDARYASQDPLMANGWIYSYDPDEFLPDTLVRP